MLQAVVANGILSSKLPQGLFFRRARRQENRLKNAPWHYGPYLINCAHFRAASHPPHGAPRKSSAESIQVNLRSGGAARPKSSRRRARSRPPPAHPSGDPNPRTPLAAPYASSGRGADIAARTEPPKKGVLAPPRRFHGARDWRRGSLKAGGRNPHEAGALPETNESVIGGPLAARRASMAGGAGRSGAAEKGGPEGAVRVGRGARGAQAGCATPARAASGT